MGAKHSSFQLGQRERRSKEGRHELGAYAASDKLSRQETQSATPNRCTLPRSNIGAILPPGIPRNGVSLVWVFEIFWKPRKNPRALAATLGLLASRYFIYRLGRLFRARFNFYRILVQH